MRLLHSRTLDFHEFVGESLRPRYAILSHTWGDEEVSYKDMLKHRDTAALKNGFQKIVKCAELAVAVGIDYFWIDTACINKSSSAELSEAINSMFRWYRDAHVCYAFLQDVSYASMPGQGSELWYKTKFARARWFTRGWTLQELIAPAHVFFYDRNWRRIGDKRGLAPHIENLTGIPRDALLLRDQSGTSIAQRFSWAAHRTTTRTEDKAYCLMGLFDVNMPMLYGEGDNAFLRLQNEIITTSNDMSIFAWTDLGATYSSYRGLFAKSPADFARCREIGWNSAQVNPPYHRTNRGLKLELPLRDDDRDPGEYMAVLRGVVDRTNPGLAVGVWLQEVGHHQYARVDPNALAVLPLLPNPAPSVALLSAISEIYVPQRTFPKLRTLARTTGISLRLDESAIWLLGVSPQSYWDEENWLFKFGHPIAQRAPPKATFEFAYGRRRGRLIINIEAARLWSAGVLLDEGWTMEEHSSSDELRYQCKPPGNSDDVTVCLSSQVVDGDLTICLSVTLAKNVLS